MTTIAERWVASDQPVIIERRALAGSGNSQALANYRSVNNIATEPGFVNANCQLVINWFILSLNEPRLGLQWSREYENREKWAPISEEIRPLRHRCQSGGAA